MLKLYEIQPQLVLLTSDYTAFRIMLKRELTKSVISLQSYLIVTNDSKSKRPEQAF